MELECEEIGDAKMVRCLEERLDAVIAVQFKESFRELTDENTQRYILDLSKVGFMDSSGLGAVVAIYKSLGFDTTFDLVGLSPPVDRVFRLTRMDTVFRIFASAKEALAASGAGNASKASA